MRSPDFSLWWVRRGTGGPASESNLQNFVYPNGVTHAYTYDTLNRLTQMGSSKGQSAISNYAYTLGLAGNRTSVAELGGRTVAYAYDSLYRLNSETVSSDPGNHNGAISYTYDNVGNRKTLTSTLAPLGGNGHACLESPATVTALTDNPAPFLTA